MDFEGKNKSPYKGVLLTSILLLTIPLVFSFFIDLFMDSKTLINRYTIFVFGFGFGILFQLSCVIAGIMKDAFAVVKARIYSFFEDVQISVKYAFEAYLDDIKVNGIVFWIYLSIMILTVVLFVLGLKELMTFM